jgi:leucyl aminopeptidase (aminopeptidase T)
MDVIMMTNTIGKVDYMTMVELGETLKKIIYEADEVIIRDKNGTNLTAYNKGREIRHSGQLATQKGYPIMLGGQISWCPIEETINGTLAFDTAVFPPTELGLISSNIKLILEEGIIKNIEGDEDAEILKAWLEGFNDSNMFRLAHYSLGFNPGVTKATGRIVEDERVFGCMEFGIGSQGSAIKGKYWIAASHADGVVSKPSIILDGETLEEDGRYVHSDVVKLCKRLGVAGY